MQKYELVRKSLQQHFVQDKDGHAWNPRWAASAITWDDALAYAKWLSESSGVETTLPSEDQWEKAARGVDGRLFPWGNTFDPTLCHIGTSRKGRPKPDVVGSAKTDVSVYGLRNLSGGAMDMIAGNAFDGDLSMRAVRGGSWQSDERGARLAGRTSVEHFHAGLEMGFRLVRQV